MMMNLDIKRESPREATQSNKRCDAMRCGCEEKRKERKRERPFAYKENWALKKTG